MAKRIDKTQIVGDLNRIAAMLGRPPTSAEVARFGKFSRNTYANHFGSFNKALRAAGLEPTIRKDITEEKILTDINRVASIVGGKPTAKQYRLHGTWDVSVPMKRFGSWDKSLEKAGFLPKYQLPRKQQIIHDIKSLAKSLGRPPNRNEFERYVAYSRAMVVKYFGSWQKALKASRVITYIASEVTSNDLIDELCLIARILHRTPKQDDFRKNNLSHFPVGIFSKIFGSFNNALKEAGFQPNVESYIDNHKLLSELNRVGNLVGHSPTMSEYEHFGRYGTAVHQRRFGSWNSALIAAGWEPNISKGTAVIAADGNFYESFGEAEIANILFQAKQLGSIANYKSRFKISKKRYWTCDFLVKFSQSRSLYLEYDGYGPKRPHHGYDRLTPKLEFYSKNKINLIIISPHRYKPSYGRLMSTLDFEKLLGTYSSIKTKPQKIEKKTAAILLDELRRVSNEIGHSPSEKQFKKHSTFPLRSYLNIWTGWQRALVAAGLEKTRNWNIAEDDLLRDLHTISKKLGRSPTGNDIRKYGKYSLATYQRKFGSYNKALNRAKLMVTKVSYVSNNQLLNELRNLSIKLGATPRKKDMDKSGQYSGQIYTIRFGSWSKACQKANLKPQRYDKVPSEALLKELARLKKLIGTDPKVKDIQEHGNYPYSLYAQKFGGLKVALKRALQNIKAY